MRAERFSKVCGETRYTAENFVEDRDVQWSLSEMSIVSGVESDSASYEIRNDDLANSVRKLKVYKQRMGDGFFETRDE